MLVTIRIDSNFMENDSASWVIGSYLSTGERDYWFKQTKNSCLINQIIFFPTSSFTK